MGKGTRQAVEVIGDVAKKAKDAVLIPLHGAFALAKAVVGGEDERDERRDAPRPRGEHSSPGARTSEPTTGSPTTSTTETSSSSTTESETTETDATLEDIWGVGASRADDLRDAGFDSVQAVADASTEDLSEVSGIGDSTAEKMIDSASDLVG